jgi:acetyl esterase/lipase
LSNNSLNTSIVPKVISAVYRTPPDHPYPAALDGAMKVWSATTKTHDPKKMVIFASTAQANV